MSENSEHSRAEGIEVPPIGTTATTETANSEANVKQDVKKEVMKKREELIKLSEDGEISQSVQNLKKSSDKVILKIYAEYEVKQAEKANLFLTDLLISMFADLLGGLGAIESSNELEKELTNDKLLWRDLKSVVEKFTPFLPYLGILSGGVTVGKHVVKKQLKTGSERSKHHTNSVEKDDSRASDHASAS